LQESFRTRDAFEDFVELADEPVKKGGDLADRVAGRGLREPRQSSARFFNRVLQLNLDLR
jgi:hypothetical protein